MFAVLVLGCVSSPQDSVARHDASPEVISQLPTSIAALDFSEPMSGSDVLTKLGLLDWAKELEFHPGLRHRSIGYSLNANHLLELHVAGIREEGIIGVTLFRDGKIIAKKINRKLAVSNNL